MAIAQQDRLNGRVKDPENDLASDRRSGADQTSREEAREDLKRGRSELRDLGSRGAEIADELRQLGRLEAELAKAEIDQSRRALMAGTMSGGIAALVGFWVLGLLAAAMTLGLAEVMEMWLAALVSAGVFLVVALVVGLIARNRFKQFSPMPNRTMASLREDLTWLRKLMKQNAASVSKGN